LGSSTFAYFNPGITRRIVPSDGFYNYARLCGSHYDELLNALSSRKGEIERRALDAGLERLGGESSIFVNRNNITSRRKENKGR